jgi:hypothetical protein
VELDFVSEELSGDVEVLAADNNDMLTVENLLGDSRGKTTCLLAMCTDVASVPRRCPLPSMTMVFSKEVIW